MVGEGLNRIGEVMIIEDMKPGDLPAIIEIEKVSFATPWSETSFFHELKNPRSFLKVAKKGGKVVGYICAGWIIDEGHVLALAVHARHCVSACFPSN
jgi:ribosomal-protein-alanine N-acetyltransferase